MRSFLRDHRRDGVLEDQLLLIVGFEHQGIFVKTFDSSGQLDAAHQVNGQDDFILASVVQKAVLDILRRLGLHDSPRKKPTPYGQVEQCYACDSNCTPIHGVGGQAFQKESGDYSSS
jgi:hypothetical protein